MKRLFPPSSILLRRTGPVGRQLPAVFQARAQATSAVQSVIPQDEALPVHAPNREKQSTILPSVTTAQTLKISTIPSATRVKFLGVSRSSDRATLKIAFDDDVITFDPIFLRDCCQCSDCQDPYSGQKSFETANIPANINIRDAAQASPDDPIFIFWSDDIPGYTDHRTQFTPEFFANQTQFKRRNLLPVTKPWDSAHMTRVFTASTTSYDEFLHTQQGFEEILDHVDRTGLALVAQVPGDEKSVEAIAERIGPLRHTFYGRTWDVKDKPKAENIAYTSVNLGLHMDLLYMKNPPGLQLLHCINASATGGESIFADTFHAAAAIEAASPVHFDDLCKFPVTYHYRKDNHHFVDSKPVFEMSIAHTEAQSSSSQTTRVPYILNTNWSPPFQGPFQVHIGIDHDGRALRNWHAAATEFSRFVNSEAALFRYRMKAGDCIIFNNRRVLHGRTAFKSDLNVGRSQKPRWLKGAYLDMDDFQSKVRGMRLRQAHS